MVRDDALIVFTFSRLQDYGSCPVAEKNAGGAVRPVEDAGEGFCTKDQRIIEQALIVLA